jgi:hypothetical protein
MRNRTLLFLLVGLIAPAAPNAALVEQTPRGKVSYITYDEAKPIFAALGDVLPADLRGASPQDLPARWTRWVVRRDAEIRARVIQGDEDSLVNFLLFGTSYTNTPRLTLEDLARAGAKQGTSPEAASFVKAIQSRTDDLIQAMVSSGRNERVLFTRQLVESKGYDLKTAQGRLGVKQYLLANLGRLLNERASYAKVLESARLLGDPSAEFAERSKLYAHRGLSSDTSLLPNFGIERALSSMKTKGMLAAGSVRRVGIIGPGLDFTDKQDGYDFYPQQTIQPFAVIDTLLRLGLARPNALRVTTFDLSERVNDHLRRATGRGRSTVPYTIQLPRNAQDRWTPEAIDFWAKFGDRIGSAVAPVAVPAGLGELKIRAVRVRPAFLSLITPEDTNIVLQRLEVPSGQGFDLLIATNILVYYDVFEQSLALANVERMLRPGGFLLSNNALLELPGTGMHSTGYETVTYSDKPGDGDHIVWYQRKPDK